MSDGKVIMGAFGKAPQQGMGGLGAEQTEANPQVVATEPYPTPGGGPDGSTVAAAPSMPVTLANRLAAIPDWMKYSALAVGLTGVGYAVWRMQNKPAAAAARKRRFK